MDTDPSNGHWIPRVSHQGSSEVEAQMERSRFVVEGQAELGLYRYPLFVDGEAVEPMLVERFRPPQVDQYYRLGRLRITTELLNEE